MDQINPYEASTDTTASAVVDRDIASAIVDFRGGIWAVIGIGVIGGVLLIALAAGFSVAEIAVLVYFSPLIAFTVALAVTSLLLRGNTTTVAKRFGLAALLSIPATLLFLPVCTACGAVGMIASQGDFLGQSSFGGIPLGVITVFSFAVVLSLFALVIRSQTRERFRQTMPIDGTTENPLRSGAIDSPASSIDPLSAQPRSD